jgi:hypothetical protein
MNARLVLRLAAPCLLALGFASPATAQTKGQLRLPEFAALADKASESVTVTLDQKLLSFACRFLSSEDPEQVAARQFCTSLTGIYVRKYTFDNDYAYPKSDIDGVRKQLSAPGWNQIVGAISKKEHTVVDVYVLIDGDKAKSLAIIASEPREFAIVNIVGSIDLEKLHELEGNFGVPKLEIETGKNAAATSKAPAPTPKK